MKVRRLVVFALFAAPSMTLWLGVPEGADQAAGLPLSKRGGAAYELLRQASTFEGPVVGYEGREPETVKAWRTLVKERAATAAFQQLLRESAMPSQLYALAGLYLVDRPIFLANHVAYLRSTEKVETLFGCIYASAQVSVVVQDILNGQLPWRFKRGWGYEPGHWWVPLAFQSGAP